MNPARNWRNGAYGSLTGEKREGGGEFWGLNSGKGTNGGARLARVECPVTPLHRSDSQGMNFSIAASFYILHGDTDRLSIDTFAYQYLPQSGIWEGVPPK